MDAPRFIVDHNVGKLARYLRMMGYDTLFYKGGDDSGLVATALAENRVILTRDRGIMERRLVTTGRLKAILLETERPDEQICRVVRALKLESRHRPFSLCLEDNQPLEERSRQQVAGRVPQYVFKTQNYYRECPACRRIYWRGTHWQAMTRLLDNLAAC
jgi:uncharacterized protein with PIN domain